MYNYINKYILLKINSFKATALMSETIRERLGAS